jgi:hypothetical protein
MLSPMSTGSLFVLLNGFSVSTIVPVERTAKGCEQQHRFVDHGEIDSVLDLGSAPSGSYEICFAQRAQMAGKS